jgi:hypothetical protein
VNRGRLQSKGETDSSYNGGIVRASFEKGCGTKNCIALCKMVQDMCKIVLVAWKGGAGGSAVG